MSLEDARAGAREALGRVRQGIDPRTARIAATAAEQHRRARTVELAIKDFIALYPRYRPSTRAEVGRVLTREVIPSLGSLPVSEVDRRGIARVINAVVDRGAGTTANRLYAYLQALFRWLIERGELETTPIVNLGKPAAERSRDRVLSETELRAVWRAAGQIGAPFGPFVHLLMLTAQRRSEVASMRRRDLDLAERVWTLPREFTKADRAHQVPLSSPAIDLLRGLMWPAGQHGDELPDDALLFAATRLRKLADPAPRHISGWSKFKAGLEKAALLEMQAAEQRTAAYRGTPGAGRRGAAVDLARPATHHGQRHGPTGGRAARHRAAA